MPRRNSVIKFTGVLERGVEAGDVQLVHQARQRLSQLALDAFIRREPEELHHIEFECGKAHALLTSKLRLPRVPDLQSETWMLKAVSQLAGLAAKMIPAPGAKLDEPDLTLRAQILLALLRHNTGRMTNSDLAERFGRGLDQITHVLRVLRQQGFVEALPRGQFRENHLTAAGRIEALKIEVAEVEREKAQREAPMPPTLRLANTLQNRRTSGSRLAMGNG